jgi:UDP-glucose 4-epimerase
MRTIFLTGVESFIGRELIRQCGQQDIRVTGCDACEPRDSCFKRADIRDPSIADLIPEAADALVHLAALSRDQDCRGKAYAAFDVNVMGTLNLVEAAKARKVKQFVFASSEWVYDRFEEGREKPEDDPVDPHKLTSEYAFSKLVSEVNLRQQFAHGFCPTTILRFGIIYGPRRDNWSAVESLLNAVATKDEVTVGSLKTARRFVHVSDIARGVLLALGLPGFEIVNLQGDRLVTLGEIVAESARLTGKGPRVTETSPDRPSIRLVSNEKARRLLSFTPKIGLAQGLRSVMDFLGIPAA